MHVFIPCWNYGDYLARTLPDWCFVLPVKPTIVTKWEDQETINVTEDNGCRWVTTDSWLLGKDAVLNKSLALETAIRNEYSKESLRTGDLCICIDADVAPRSWTPGETFSFVQPETVYGVKRYNDSTDEFEPPANLPYITKRGRADSPESCGGYFQMFRYNPERSFGSYPTAAKYDYDFAFSFPHGETLPGTFTVSHLGERRKNWSGRVTPRLPDLTTQEVVSDA